MKTFTPSSLKNILLFFMGFALMQSYRNTVSLKADSDN